ncbi:MAG: FAD binding domain-containing protein, partial [Mesorhizobium sp.]|nr:FAD binding domain-containing protein [Mesorhizobium sp.]
MLQSVATPGSVPEAHQFLSASGARIIAGGTAVMPALNAGTDAFTSLVSLRKAGLSFISVTDGAATIGAATPLADLEAEPALAFLRPALDLVASPTLRNMATVGGNLFVKAPYGDLAACLIALGATATVAGASGSRIEPVEQTVAGIKPGEIVTQLSVALPAEGACNDVKAGRKARTA